MGMFDFIKDAGEKLADLGDDVTLSRKISERIATHGVKVKDLQVAVKGEHVNLKGMADSMEDQEKALLIAGNVRGISRVIDELTVKGEIPTVKGGVAVRSVAGRTRFYAVVSGDTLSGISKKMYGDANKYMKVFEANKPMLNDPDRIYPGQVLRIPE
jgi:nucleoid-associated protein YgaU